LPEIKYTVLNSLYSVSKEKTYLLKELLEIYEQNIPDAVKKAELEKQLNELNQAFTQAQNEVGNNIATATFEQVRRAIDHLVSFATAHLSSVRGQV